MENNIENIGAYLKQLREEQKTSVAQVAQALKTKLEVIQALEANEFDKLPAPTYVKGYLRSYASYLGINPDELLAEYNKKFPKGSKQVIILQGEQFPRFGIDLNIKKIFTPKLFVGIGVGIIAIAAILFMSFYISHIKHTTIKTEPAKQAPSQEEKPVKIEKAQKAEPKEPTQKQQTTALPSSITTPITLSANPSEDAWVRILVDNKKIFEGVLKKNDKENWTAQNEIKIRAAKPAKMNFSLNGKPVTNISPYGPVNIVINKNGVKVEK